MNTTVEALKGLYVVLGGQLTDTYADIAGGIAVSDYVLIPDCIQAITQKATGGSGGGEAFIINVETEEPIESEDGTTLGQTLIADKTSAEITAAIDSGKSVFVNYNNPPSGSPLASKCQFIPLSHINIYKTFNRYVFTAVHIGDGDTYVISVYIGTDDNDKTIDIVKHTQVWS